MATQTPHSNDNIKQLTFGVEIECVLAFPRIDVCDQQTEHQMKRIVANQDPHAQREQCIREPLRQAGLHVSSQTEDFNKTYSQWNVKSDASAEFRGHDFTSPMRCSNGDEILNYEDMAYCSVEVVSPILPLTIEGLQQVQIAVRTLQEQRIIVSNSCGYHLHIGNDIHGFSLPLLQNLAVLTSCFEQQWNQAHPSTRLFSAHCRLPRESFWVEERDRRSMANILYGLTSFEDLIETMHLPRNHRDLPSGRTFFLERGRVVNYLNLKAEIGGCTKRTIEFRQHAGTIDIFVILRWIVTVGAAVKLADDLPVKAIWDIIQAHVQEDGEDDWTFSLLDLFKAFGVEWLTPLWDGHLYSHPVHHGSDIPGDMSWGGTLISW